MMMTLSMKVLIVAGLMVASFQPSIAKPNGIQELAEGQVEEQVGGEYQVQESLGAGGSIKEQEQSYQTSAGAKTGFLEGSLDLFSPFTSFLGGAKGGVKGAEVYADKQGPNGKGIKKYEDWHKLLFNPVELVKAISHHFNLPLEPFIEKVGQGLVLGFEAVLYPLVVSLKIIEKVFVPDVCRLGLVCKMGAYFSVMKESVTRLSPGFLEVSKMVRALSEGMAGRDCSQTYVCEVRLKPGYEELKGSARSIGAQPAGVVGQPKV